MKPPKAQVCMCAEGRQVNVWLPHKKCTPKGAHGAPGKKAFFVIVGGPQDGSALVWVLRLTMLPAAPLWCEAPS